MVLKKNYVILRTGGKTIVCKKQICSSRTENIVTLSICKVLKSAKKLVFKALQTLLKASKFLARFPRIHSVWITIEIFLGK